jgi:hypothetical protein
LTLVWPREEVIEDLPPPQECGRQTPPPSLKSTAPQRFYPGRPRPGHWSFTGWAIGGAMGAMPGRTGGMTEALPGTTGTPTGTGPKMSLWQAGLRTDAPLASPPAAPCAAPWQPAEGAGGRCPPTCRHARATALLALLVGAAWAARPGHRGGAAAAPRVGATAGMAPFAGGRLAPLRRSR